MIQALLAAADPLERMERGAPASTYEPLAAVVLASLRQGADIRRIVVLLNEQGVGDQGHDALALNPVVAFAEAAVDWWAHAASRWEPSLAM
jgi:hypothetical protein